MVLGGDGTRGALAVTHGPVLSEGRCARDRGLIGAGVRAQGVGGSVGLDGTELSNARGARVEAAVGLNDVVLSLRVVDPTVDSEVGTAVAGRVRARVVDGPAWDVNH